VEDNGFGSVRVHQGASKGNFQACPVLLLISKTLYFSFSCVDYLAELLIFSVRRSYTPPPIVDK
jgi:hypothetical protein